MTMWTRPPVKLGAGSAHRAPSYGPCGQGVDKCAVLEPLPHTRRTRVHVLTASTTIVHEKGNFTTSQCFPDCSVIPGNSSTEHSGQITWGSHELKRETTIDRERRLVERRIRAAKFPTVKSLDSFEFKAIPSLSKIQVLELARCEWIERRENVIALGPSGTGKTHVAQGLGLAACQRGLSVRFVTAAALVHELMEARDERRLQRLQKQFANHKLLIIDELGFVPLSKTGAELLFELVSQRYERAAVLITSNLPFDEWTETFGTERLTGALLDRLTHHVHILEMNGQSFRLNHSRARNKGSTT